MNIQNRTRTLLAAAKEVLRLAREGGASWASIKSLESQVEDLEAECAEVPTRPSEATP